MSEAAPERLIDVEVAYATPREQLIVSLRVPAGTTAAEAVERSGIRIRFPEIEAEPLLGIFSHKVASGHPLAAGDRVEIYRPLMADPKEVRRRKARRDRDTGS
jgi:putative ubiquitin-RnfH superfamily antitoxin RatB of RatAB toxin-antitoxin module